MKKNNEWKKGRDALVKMLQDCKSEKDCAIIFAHLKLMMDRWG